VADFYDDNGLTPAAIPTVEALDDVSYVTAHLYETHDVWHVASGFGTSVADELGVQAIYAAQLPGRLAAILIGGGLIQAALWVQGDFTSRLAAVAHGFALGRRARPLFGVRWDELWEQPIEDVRRKLGLSRRGIVRGAAGLGDGCERSLAEDVDAMSCRGPCPATP
jgi:ubiquinone biosynthesis protein Coq4